MNTIDKMIKTPGVKTIIFTLVYFCFFVGASAFLLFSVFQISLEFVVEESIAIKSRLGVFALLLTLLQITLSAILIGFGVKLLHEARERRREFDRRKLEKDGDASFAWP